MLSPSLLDSDQQAAITRLIEFDHTLLVAGMGAGKTVIAATAIDELLDTGALGSVLVLAPLKTLEETWPRELTEWEHLAESRWWQHAGFAIGSAKQRARVIEARSPIVLLNFENLAWLAKNYDIRAFDGLLIDESTKLKTTGTVAFKRLRSHIRHFQWRCAMSGTPVSENLVGLFGQMLLVDGGVTLGRNRQKYLDEFFVPEDYQRYSWAPRSGAREQIVEKVAPYVHYVPDYTHSLPRLMVKTHSVRLPPEARERYWLLAREMVLGEDITASNEAVLTQKLQQVASGFIYTDEKETIEVHDAKWAALDQLLAGESEPVILVYWWQSQKEQLLARGIPLLSSETIEAWNRGELARLAVHPRSAGHGLNLQHGGARMIWLAPQWSRDLHDQTIARLWRRGQTRPVRVTVLLAEDTVDPLVWETLTNKASYHARFVEHLAHCQEQAA